MIRPSGIEFEFDGRPVYIYEHEVYDILNALLKNIDAATKKEGPCLLVDMFDRGVFAAFDDVRGGVNKLLSDMGARSKPQLGVFHADDDVLDQLVNWVFN